MNPTIELAPPLPVTRPRDKYDEAIEYLTKHPEKIHWSWASISGPGGCLFQTVTPSGSMEQIGKYCGCLTQVRMGAHAWTEELRQEIAADLSLPETIHEVTPHHLPIFARWQRRLDKELNRI